MNNKIHHIHPHPGPFVHLILASEFDESDGEFSRYVQELRQKYDCIIVGRKTIEAHNPTLIKNTQTLRLVVGSLSGINRGWNILNDEFKRNTMIVTTEEEIQAHPDVAYFLEREGVALLPAGIDEKGRVDLRSMLKSLASLKLTSILLEGGPTLAKEFLKQGLVDLVTISGTPAIDIPDGIKVEHFNCPEK